MKHNLSSKVLALVLALVMVVGLVPAGVMNTASAETGSGNTLTEWEANALLAGAGTSVVEIALENHYDDPNTDPYGMCGGNSHLQGIAVDDELKYMFFSYTSALAIIEIATGELVASIGGFGGGSFGTNGGAHLGCIDYYDGYIYGSLEYKSPGKKFYLAIFDVERMLDAGVGVSIQDDSYDWENPICTAVLLEESTRDFRDPIDTTLFSGQDEFGHATNEGNNGHWFACSGIDGVSMGKWPGGKDDEIYMIVAYGVYAFTGSARQDNTYNVLSYYKLSDIWNEDGTQTEWNKTFSYNDGIHQDWAKDESVWLSAEKNLYVYTGNTSYGSQNIEYEWDTGDVVLYTYGNTDGMGGTYYEVDGSVEPELKTLNLGQHSSDEWVQNVAKAYADYPDAVDVDEDGYMMGYVGTLKCVCGKEHDTEGTWPTGAPKADNFICSSSIPASNTTGTAWIGPDPTDPEADWFYIADGSYSTGLYKRTYSEAGQVSWSKKVWLEEEPLDAEPVLWWTMDAADMDFENNTLVNSVDETTFPGLFQNVKVGKGMDGKDGGSLYFDGDADVLDYSRVWMDDEGIADLQAMVDGSNQITISFWYKPEYVGNDNFTSDWSPILGIYSDARTVQPGQFVLVAEHRYSSLVMCMNNYGAKTSWPVDIRSANGNNHTNVDWHHIVMTVDLTKNYGTSLTGGTSLYREFYIDGIKINQERALYPENKDTTFDNLTDFEIGGAPYKCWADSNVRGRFSGWIDDVKIYDVAVTAKQAAWLLQHEPETADFDMSTLPEEVLPEVESVYVFDKANPADLTIGDVVVSKDVLMQYQPGPNTIEGETVYIVNGEDAYALLSYALTADTADASGNGMDAEAVNAVANAITADGAFFDGYDETVVNRIMLTGTDFIEQAIAGEATITFSFKSSRLVGNITNLVGLYDGARPGLVAQFRDEAGGGERPGGGEKVRLAGQVFTDSSKAWNSNVVGGANNSLHLNDAWHTAAVVYDGTKLSVYLDGALVSEAEVAADALEGVDSLVLGGPVNRVYASGVTSKSQQVMTNFYGTLKDVVVYNAALTAEQLAAGANTAADVSGLEYALELFAEAAADADKYKEELWAAAEAAAEAAEAELANPTSGEAVTEAGLALVEALENLVDTSALEAALAEAEELNSSEYTIFTWADVEEAMAEAEAVLADENASQAEIDAAAAALIEAMENLEKRGNVTPGTSSGGVTEPDEDEEPEQPVVECPSEHLTDVADAWYHEYVDYVVAEGLMTGTTATTFDPTGTMTRAMVWTVLARMDGENVDGGTPWYAKAQTWAMENEVSDGTMANDSITREQLVTMLYRYLGEPEVTAADKALLDDFVDGAKVSDWAVDAMAWAVSNGIITGVTETTLDPQGVATRAQVAAILMRYCEL